MKVLASVDASPEQLKVLVDTGIGFRLIRGAAGSGKTTTAILRINQLCAARISRNRRIGRNNPVRVLVLTFNRTLRGYIDRLVFDQVDSNEDVRIEVTTFAKWAMSLIGFSGEIPNQDNTIKKLLTDASFKNNLDYLKDEVAYINGRFRPESKDSYLSVERTGRGRRPLVSQEHRISLLEKVLGPYESEKNRLQQIDWNDLALSAVNEPCGGYDVVVVDEAQDFSANQVRALKAHLNEDHTTTFIIDAVQRIYPQFFHWREVGIEIRPEMVYQLKQNHRNTAAIARFATSLVAGLSSEEDGVVPDPSACVREGKKPEILAGKFSKQVDYMLNSVSPYLEKEETVAILHPKGWSWFRYVRAELAQRNKPFCEISQESEWPEGIELVALSTIHSAKGLEFDHILMPGLNQELTSHGNEHGDGTLETLQRLVAMGIARARNTVTLGYKPEDKSTLIGLFDPDTYTLVKLE